MLLWIGILLLCWIPFTQRETYGKCPLCMGESWIRIPQNDTHINTIFQECCTRSMYQGRGQVITSHRYWGCNYSSPPLIPASDTTLLIYVNSFIYSNVSPSRCNCWKHPRSHNRCTGKCVFSPGLTDHNRGHWCIIHMHFCPDISCTLC